MNILLIVPYNVFEAKHGNAMRVKAMMETILKNGDKISLLMYDFPWTKRIDEMDGVKAYLKPIKFKIIAMAALMKMLFRASSYDLLCAKIEPFGGFKELVKEIIREDGIDVIQCENIWTVPSLASIIDDIRKPIVVTAHDVWSDRFGQLYAYQKVAGFVSRRLLKSIREEEEKALRMCEICVCVSEEDRRQLIKNGANPVIMKVIPNGVDTSKIRPVGKVKWLARELKIGDEDIVLFFPGSEMFQNKKAAEDVIKDILPKLDNRFKMVFAGTICHHLEKLDLPEWVITVGYLEDLSPLYGLADIVVLPVTVGSGTKLKTVEAMAAGKAIITTPAGAIGLPSEDRGCMKVEQDIEAFAQRIVEIAQDKEIRSSMGINARENALKYDWSLLMSQYIDIYKQVVLPVVQANPLGDWHSQIKCDKSIPALHRCCLSLLVDMVFARKESG